MDDKNNFIQNANYTKGFVATPMRHRAAQLSHIQSAASQTSAQGATGVGLNPQPDAHLGAQQSRTLTKQEYSAFGPLAPFIMDTDITDIFVNGTQGVWIDRGRGSEKVDLQLGGSLDVRDLAVRIIACGGRHLDDVNPAIDVRIGPGIRVHAVLDSLSPTGSILSIRIPKAENIDMEYLVSSGFFYPGSYEFIKRAVLERKNILIAGAGGSGKTTFLSAILSLAGARERIITIEDVCELRIAHPHVVSLQAKQANTEGAGCVSLSSLVRESLRMRPDRLVLGECRGEEVRDLLLALNTGHSGGAGTLHANSMMDVASRLEALGALVGMSAQCIARQVCSAIDFIVFLRRENGVRKLVDIGKFDIDDSGRLCTSSVPLNGDRDTQNQAK